MPPENMYEKRWMIAGLTFETACDLMCKIEETCGKEVLNRINGRNHMCTEFADGTILRWLPTTANCHGQRCGKMWCDKNIDRNIFKYVVLPMYFGKLEDIIWV